MESKRNAKRQKVERPIDPTLGMRGQRLHRVSSCLLKELNTSVVHDLALIICGYDSAPFPIAACIFQRTNLYGISKRDDFHGNDNSWIRHRHSWLVTRSQTATKMSMNSSLYSERQGDDMGNWWYCTGTSTVLTGYEMSIIIDRLKYGFDFVTRRYPSIHSLSMIPAFGYNGCGFCDSYHGWWIMEYGKSKVPSVYMPENQVEWGIHRGIHYSHLFIIGLFSPGRPVEYATRSAMLIINRLSWLSTDRSSRCSPSAANIIGVGCLCCVGTGEAHASKHSSSCFCSGWIYWPWTQRTR